eukprot:403334017
MEQMSNNEFEKLKNSDVEQANTKISEHEETKKQLAVQPPTTSAINQTRSKYGLIKTDDGLKFKSHGRTINHDEGYEGISKNEWQNLASYDANADEVEEGQGVASRRQVLRANKGFYVRDGNENQSPNSREIEQDYRDMMRQGGIEEVEEEKEHFVAGRSINEQEYVRPQTSLQAAALTQNANFNANLDEEEQKVVACHVKSNKNPIFKAAGPKGAFVPANAKSTQLIETIKKAVASSQSINRQEDVNQRDMIQARQDHYGQDSGNSKDCFAELDGSPQPTNESPVSNTANQIDSDLGREPTGSAQTQEQTDVIPERDNQSNQLDIDKDIAEEQHEVPSEVVSPSQDRELIVPSQEIQIDEILSTDDQNTGVAGVVDAEQQSSPQSIQERPSYARSQSNIDESIRVNPMLGRMEHSNLFVRPTAQDDQDDDEEDYFRPTYFPKQKRSIGDIEQGIAQPGSEEKKVVQEEEKVQKVKPKREEEKKASQNVPSQKLKANDDIQDGHSSGKRTPKIPQAQKAREERVFLGLMQDACSTKKKMIQDDKLEEEKKKRYGK